MEQEIKDITKERLENYLLGQLSEAEKDELEDSYFVDDELFNQLKTVEDKLIGEYVSRNLTGIKREQFEKFYMTTKDRRSRVFLAEGLKEKSAKAMLESYLLGQLSEKERDDLEENYFADDRLFNQMKSVENNLIEDYVSQKLESEKRKQFEKFYMTTGDRRRRVFIAQGLEQKAEEEFVLQNAVTEIEVEGEQTERKIIEPSVPFWKKFVDLIVPQTQSARYGLAYGMAIVLFGTVALSIYTYSLKSELNRREKEIADLQNLSEEEKQKRNNEIARLNTEKDYERETREALDDELDDKPKKQNGTEQTPIKKIPKPEITFTERDSGTTTADPTGSNAKRVEIPNNARLIKFTFNFNPGEAWDSYTVTLNDKVVRTNVKGRGKGTSASIRIHVLAKSLRTGNNVFVVKGNKQGEEPLTLTGFVINVVKK